MSSNVRNIMMRALFEPDFHNLLVSNPDEALKGYSLTQPEVDALKNPSPALYRFLQPGTDVLGAAHGALLAAEGPPTPSVVVTVIIVVAITVFAAATTVGPSVGRYSPLISAIQQSTGAARADLVKTLINELTKGQ